MSNNLLNKYSFEDDTSVSTVELLTVSTDEVVELDSTMNSLLEVFDSLEVIRNDLCTVHSNNHTLTPTAIELVNRAINEYGRQLGINFDSVSNEKLTTSTDALHNTLSKLWITVKMVATKTGNSISTFFSKVFNNIDNIIKRLNGLIKVLPRILTTTRKPNVEIMLEIIHADLMQFSGKIDHKSMVNGLQTLNSLVKDMYSDYVKVLDNDVLTYHKAILDMSMTKNVEVEERILRDIRKSNEYIFSKVKSHITGRITIGDKLFRANVATGTDQLSRVKVEMGVVDKYTKYSGDRMVDEYTIQEMTELLRLSLSILTNMKAGKNTINVIHKHRVDLLNLVDKVVGDNEGVENSPWGKVQNRVLLSHIQSDPLQPITQVTTHSFHVIKTIINIVENTLNKYNGYKVV